MQTKVKITDLASGQDYLLLVTKMNLKGILVQSAHTIPMGRSLRLSLQLGSGESTLELKGQIHKIAEKPGGGKGMIIRFIDPDPASLKKIESHLLDMEENAAASVGGLSRDKTVLTDLNTLSPLALSSSDKDQSALPSTMDEEEVHAQQPGLAGETRILSGSEVGMSYSSRGRKKSFKTVQWAVFGAVLVAAAFFLFPFGKRILRMMDREFGPSRITEAKHEPERTSLTPVAGSETSDSDEQTSTEGVLETEPTPELQTTEPEPAQISTPAPTPAPRPKAVAPAPKAQPSVAGRVADLSVEETEAFLKITLKGNGDFSVQDVSRAMSPKRLIVDLPKFTKSELKSTIAVSKNPLFKIRTRTSSSGTRIIFDLYPVNFPRYELKSYTDSLDIFVYK